jgi:hypothetical protein
MSVVAPPSWLKLGSQATWNSSTGTLTVTGQSTIIADPGSAEPIIIASGAAAQLTIDPATPDVDVHLGGVNLSNGAQVVVSQTDVPNGAAVALFEFVNANHSSDHTTIVLGTTTETSDPVFTIDATSKFDLGDNDLIYHTSPSDVDGGAANLLALQNLVATGRDGGVWDGNELTSSVAEAQDSSDGIESTQLGVVDNNDLTTPFSSWTVGSASEPLNGDDIIVKYTYTGDFTLAGEVTNTDVSILALYYDGGASTGNEWAFGDTNGDGLLNNTDVSNLSLDYLDGTGVGGGGTDPYLL